MQAIWPIFRDIVQAGSTYAYPVDTDFAQARVLWLETPRQTWVVEDGQVRFPRLYYITFNQAGPGAHVCNCGYMVAAQARGRGLATLMCEHSQQQARALGYKAMQFNFVAASNTVAVQLWHKLGFSTVGRLPWAFNHPQQGYVDALVMYKWLETMD
ncbi:MAG: GNAT family N-acetyltransferase [Thiolinea sp.]